MNRYTGIVQALLALVVLAAGAGAAGEEGCCTVISVDGETGLVVARDAAGNEFRFAVDSLRLLNDLAVDGHFELSRSEAGTLTLAIGDSGEGADTFDDCCTLQEDDTWLPEELADAEPESSVDGFDVADEFADAVAFAAAEVAPEQEIRTGVLMRVTSLQRLGGHAVKLTFDIENRTGKPVILSDLGMAGRSSVSQPYDLRQLALVDYDAGLKYGVIVDDAGRCQCSHGSRSVMSVPVDEVRSFWARFSAPPGDVTQVSLEVPGVVPFDGLAVR